MKKFQVIWQPYC